MSLGKAFIDALASFYKPLAAGAFVIAVSIYIVEKFFEVDPTQIRDWIFGGIVTLVVSFLSYAYIPSIWTDWNARRNSRNPHIKLLEREITLHFIDDQTIRYRNYYRAKATKPNVETFAHRLSWSGAVSAITIQESIGGHLAFHRVEERPGTDCVFRFEFPLVVGSIVSFGYQIEINDSGGLIRNYAGASEPYFPEEKLTIRFIDERKLKITANRLIYSNDHEITAEKNEIVPCDANEDCWSIDTPEHGKAYILRAT